MNYYRLTDDIYADDHRILGDVSDGEDVVDAELFTTTIPFTDSKNLSIQSEDGPDFDFALAAFDVPIVSKKFARLIQPIAPQDVQLIPVTIGDKSGYFILNVLQKLPCLDESQSVYVKWRETDGRSDRTGQYRMVSQLKVDPKKAKGVHVLRIKGWDVPLVVSNKIGEVVRGHGIRGAVLEPLS